MIRRIGIPTVRARNILLLVAILVALSPLSLHIESVTNAQTETVPPVPGGGGDPGGPDAPVLTATPGPSWINVSWEPVAGADMYDILWREGDSGSWHRSSGSPQSSTTHGFLGLAAGTTWQFLVRAIDADGKVSAWSQLFQETVPDAPTQTPTPTPTVTAKLPAPTLSATSTGATSVELSWTEVSGADKYDLRVWWYNGPGWQPIDEERFSGRSYTDDQVMAGRPDYHYIVAAVDSNGVIGEWSEDVSVPAPGKLPAPTLSATFTGATSVELSWTEVSGADHYLLWVWWNSDPGWQPIDKASFSGRSYTDDEVTAGRPDYFYSVAAVDSNGVIGEESEHVLVSAPTTPTPTPTSTPVQTPTPTSTPVQTPTPTTTPAQSPTPTTTPAQSPTPTTTPVQTPTPTTTPAQSPTPTTTPVQTLAPTPTANVSGKLPAPTLNAIPTGANTVDLSWSEVFGAVRYVLFAWDYVNLWQPLGGDNLKGTSFSHKDGTAGTTYIYTVAAVDVNNLWSDFSGRKRVTVPGAYGLLLPPPLTATYTMSNTVELRWTQVTHAVRYDIWTSLDNTITWQNIDDSLDGTSYLHSDLTPGTTYSYAIRAIDADGVGGAYTQFPYPEATVPESSVIQDAAEERAALVALYEAADGVNWTQNDNWSTAASISSWYGVTTDESGRVVELLLSGNGLSGLLTDLSALTNLTILDLSYNQLSGRIPDLSALTNLRNLFLSDNQLDGPIPDLSTLTKLTTLDLGFNQLTGSFPGLSALTDLTSLSLGSNQLNGPLPDLSALTSLTDLYLTRNQFSGSIPDLSALSNLRELYLGDNQLEGQIPDLSALTNLTWLDLSHNELEGLPQNLGALTNLTWLSISYNQLTGSIPDLSALTQLTFLALSNNKLTGKIPELSALAKLTYLDLSANQLNGPIPDLNALTNLTGLSLKGNNLCLPEGSAALSGSNEVVVAYLKRLNPPSCEIGENTVTQEESETQPEPQQNPAEAEERAALVALYGATDGANWTHNDNWRTDEPIATWYGVSMDDSGRVAELRLPGNGLSGSIQDLSALSNLTGLFLGSNNLSGQIPNLDSLSNLKVLSLHFNQLSGPIPNLDALTNLTWLNLLGNKLSGSIPNLSALTKLSTLAVGGNQLDGSIPDLSTLTNLTTLYLYHNHLTGHIPDLSALTNLTNLGLSNNELDGSIPGLGTLTKLEYLSLPDNQLSGEIPDLSALTSLTYLSLSTNKLTGSIPDLSTLTNLTGLDLSTNQLDGPVPDLSALTKLKTLQLAGNQLCLPGGSGSSGSNAVVTAYLETLNLPSCASGTIPEETVELEKPPTLVTTGDKAALVALYEATDGSNWIYSDNWLKDEPIATWYGVIADDSGRVTELKLPGNRLSGTIPDLSAFTSLKVLDLHYNNLMGSIPELSTNTSLTRLSLTGNKLTGSIPELNALTNLRELYLTSNLLDGSIPNLSALTNLTGLFLSYNMLTGPIPDLSALNNLTHLHLNRNKLTGSIPNLSALTNLKDLSLGSNNLTGSIQELVTLASLIELSISGNQLDGPIPNLNALTELRTLFLNHNQFTGPMPDLSALTKLTKLSIGSNQLTGPIRDLSALTNLTFLFLSDNQLTGPIPDLSLLTKLKWLHFSDNQLAGPILNLNHLPDLSVLFLDHNQLTGPIPDLNGLTNLTLLDLTENQLCLPAGSGLSGPNDDVIDHLESLDLTSCTSAETMLAPGVTQFMTSTIGVGQVTLTWGAAANAASYELRAWDSINRQWGPVSGSPTPNTAYTHTILTDGRAHFFQVRAINANDVRGAWSERVYVPNADALLPPPPMTLGLDIFYQKYLDAGGVAVVAPTEVSDEKLFRARDIFTSTLSSRPDLIETMVANRTRIALYGYTGEASALLQLPEFNRIGTDALGIAQKTLSGWVAGVPDLDPICGVLLHEIAHLTHYAIELQPEGQEFNSRLQDLYRAAMGAGLWKGSYASTNFREYWAEAAMFWFRDSLPSSLPGNYSQLEDYDPAVAKLVEEVFGDVTPLTFCKN